MKLKLDIGINSVDLSEYYKYVDFNARTEIYFLKDAGIEHYKLLAYLSSQLPKGSEVSDLGTLEGMSALAFASNKDVLVTTYDICECIPESVTLSIKNISNIRRVMADCKQHIKNMINSKIILLDIAPHDGGSERWIIEQLQKEDYRGLVVCDDIHLSNEMNSFWDDVTLKKLDATQCGHWSGTGIIIFNPNTLDISSD